MGLRPHASRGSPGAAARFAVPRGKPKPHASRAPFRLRLHFLGFPRAMRSARATPPNCAAALLGQGSEPVGSALVGSPSGLAVGSTWSDWTSDHPSGS